MGQAMGPCELGNHPAVPDVQLTIQSCHTTNESIQLDSLFDPAKAAVFYNEKHVALMQERAQLQSAKHDFAVEESAKEAALQHPSTNRRRGATQEIPACSGHSPSYRPQNNAREDPMQGEYHIILENGHRS